MGRNNLLIEILEERIEEIKADILEFSALELDAVDEKSKLRYGMLVAQYNDMLADTRKGLELTKERNKKLYKLNVKVEELLNGDVDELDFDDILKTFLHILDK